MAKKKGGKVPQGRAKQKQKAQKAGNSGSQWSRYGQGDVSDDEDDNTNITFRGFGGTTSRRYAPQDPSIKLRHKSIAFISAGTNTPTVIEEEESTMIVTEQELNSPVISAEEVDATLISAIELNDGEEVIPQFDGVMEFEEHGKQETTSQNPNDALFVVDTTGELNMSNDKISTSQTPDDALFVVDTMGDSNTSNNRISTSQILRRPSLTPSDSSEEVILFQGRNKAVVINDPLQVSSAINLPVRQLNKSFDEPVSQWAIAPSKLAAQPATHGFTPVPDGAFWRHGSPRNVDEFAAQPQEAQETIEMLQAAWKQAKKEKRESKTVAEDTSKISRRGKRGRKQSNRLLRTMEDSDPDDAAIQDYLENLEAQEEETDEPIPDAVDVDMALDKDQDWEDTEMTNGESSEDAIGEDLSDVFDDDDDDLNASDLDSSELEEELTRAELEMIQAEDALHRNRQQSRSDAQIARLWAKQIELGIEADELVIDDGEVLEIEGVGDVQAARSGFADFVAFTERRPKRGKRRELSFPDASALADTIDQYGNEAFDIMDYDRPSLRATKKGRKGVLPPELDALSDEELKNNMVNTWDKDRAKKRLKKAEREELRMQGLLGSSARKGKADLGQKYQQGMTMLQVHEEIKIFLEDDGKTTRSFPPMDKEDRKALHHVANALNLKSKSIGTGLSRAPVLYKTKTTLQPDDDTFERIINASTRGFLKNQGWSKNKKAKPIKRSGGAAMGATGLRHGEVVGAGAKEIGKENFGHRLMEKMGWSQGMALGKEGEGRLVPVEQIMRIGRAGL